MTLSYSQLMIKYPPSSRHNSRPASILSLHDIAALLAKCDAEFDEESWLLEEAEGLLPHQAPPEPSSGLIGYSGPENARCCCAQYSDTPCGAAAAAATAGGADDLDSDDDDSEDDADSGDDLDSDDDDSEDDADMDDVADAVMTQVEGLPYP